MSYKLVQWALQRAPLLPAGRGGGPTARLNLLARCEEQRDGNATHCLSVSVLMHRTGLSAAAIKASTKALEAAGLIKSEGAKDGIPRYSINSGIVREDELTDFVGARMQSRGVTQEPPRGATEEPPQGVSEEPSIGGLPGNPGVTEEPCAGATEKPHSRTGKRTTTADAVVGAPAVDPAPTSKPRNPRTPKDPAKDASAQDLATRYYEAMAKQVNFLAVRSIVRKALDAFPFDQVNAGLASMARGSNRSRPLTRQTLLTALEDPHGSYRQRGATTTGNLPMPGVGNYSDNPFDFGETA